MNLQYFLGRVFVMKATIKEHEMIFKTIILNRIPNNIIKNSNLLNLKKIKLYIYIDQSELEK